MDLKADKKVQLSVQLTDEMENPVPAPAGTVITWSVDNTTVISLTQNADDSATAAATGILGNAIVSVSVALPSGQIISGDLLLSVVAGDAERVVITPGAVTEVTPDA